MTLNIFTETVSLNNITIPSISSITYLNFDWDEEAREELGIGFKPQSGGTLGV